MYTRRRGVGEGRTGRGEKNGISVYRAHPKVPELLTPSLTTSLLATSWKGKDRRPWVWVEGGGPGLNSRPRHLASGARPIWLNPLSPPVLQSGRHRALVPVGDHQIPLSPKVLTSGVRGYKGRADQKGQAVGSRGLGVQVGKKDDRPGGGRLFSSSSTPDAPTPTKSAEPAAAARCSAPGWGPWPRRWGWLGMGGVGAGGSQSPSSGWLQGANPGQATTFRPPESASSRQRRERGAGRAVAPAHLADRAGRSSAGRPSPSLGGPRPYLRARGCRRGGCWGAASGLPVRLSGGQRQRGRRRGRCSWRVAPGALRPRPRRRLPPRPLRGLPAGTQLPPQPRSPPPLRLPGRGRSRLQRRPARSRASGSQRRPAPGPGVAAARPAVPAPL